MKKFISLVLAMLMFCSFATISAFANECTLTFSDARIDGEKVYVDIILTPAYSGSLMTIDINYTFPADKLTFVKCSNTDFTGSVMINAGKISWADMSMLGVTPSSTVLYTLEFTKSADATGSVELGFVSPTKVVDNDTMEEIEGIKYVGKTISLGGNEAKTKYIPITAVTKLATNAVIDPEDGKFTDAQIGAAFGVKFTLTDEIKASNKMAWALTLDGTKKYALKAINADYFTLLAGDVGFAGTIITGTHKGDLNKDGKLDAEEIVSNIEVTAPALVFINTQDTEDITDDIVCYTDAAYVNAE